MSVPSPDYDRFNISRSSSEKSTSTTVSPPTDVGSLSGHSVVPQTPDHTTVDISGFSTSKRCCHYESLAKTVALSIVIFIFVVVGSGGSYIAAKSSGSSRKIGIAVAAGAFLFAFVTSGALIKRIIKA